MIGSGTVGSGCILELTPEAVGGWLKPGDVVELTIERLGTLRQPRRCLIPEVGMPRSRRDNHAALSATRLDPAQAAHRPSAAARASRTRASTTRKSSPRAGFGRAYSIVYHLRPPTRVTRLEPAGTIAARFRRAARAAASSSQDRRRCRRAGDPITGRVPLLRQRRRDAAPAAGPRSRKRSCTATPMPTRSSSSTRGRGTLAHDVRPAAVQAVRLRRHPALHDVPARVRAGIAARLAGDRGDRQRRRFPPRYLNPDGQFRLGCALLRARPARPDARLGVIDRERGNVRARSRTAAG